MRLKRQKQRSMEAVGNDTKEMIKIRKKISELLNVSEKLITRINYLTKGMTNHSYRFFLEENEYIIRVPGEGSDQLVNRENEAQVYRKLKGRHISDEVVYISGETGYKITKYWADSRTCNPLDQQDVVKSMEKLREFHNLRLTVSHSFNVFDEIEFYETLRKGAPSIFSDYEETKNLIKSLEPLIGTIPKECVLTHVDSNPDNILFVNGEVRFIDWEYSAMHDPHLDIAMFAIYSMYDRTQTDFLINSYFSEGCNEQTRMKIYAYMAMSGLLWSNWCEFKLAYGIDYEGYTVSQYEYAKEFGALA